MLQLVAKRRVSAILLAAVCGCSRSEPPQNYMAVGALDISLFSINRSQGTVFGTYTLKRANGHSIDQTTFTVSSQGSWLILSAHGSECARYKFSFQPNELQLTPQTAATARQWHFAETSQNNISAWNSQLRDMASAPGPFIRLPPAARAAFDSYWRGYPKHGCPTDGLSH